MKDSKISRFHILIKTQNEFENSNYEEKFSLDFTIFFLFLPFFVSIYVLPIKVLDYVRQRVKDRVPETKYRINRVRTEVEFLIKTG